ncbi:hypothetical protein FRC18_003233 [Serendipita sp. 400]|nr:hypothetical protein FRC18_003233 [Serendipita sp. 400]
MRRALKFVRNYATKQNTTSTSTLNPRIQLRHPELSYLRPIPRRSPRHISLRRTEPASVGHLAFAQPAPGGPLDPQHPFLRGGSPYRKCPFISSDLFTARLIPYGILAHVEPEKMPPFDLEPLDSPGTAQTDTKTPQGSLDSTLHRTSSVPNTNSRQPPNDTGSSSNQAITCRFGPEGEKIRYRSKRDKPNVVYASFMVVASKAANHKDAVIRRKTGKRIREALKLIVTRGAKASEDGSSVVFEPKDVGKDKWLYPDSTYLLFTKLEAYRAPWPVLLTTLRNTLVQLTDGMAKSLRSTNNSKHSPSMAKSKNVSNPPRTNQNHQLSTSGKRPNIQTKHQEIDRRGNNERSVDIQAKSTIQSRRTQPSNQISSQNNRPKATPISPSTRSAKTSTSPARSNNQPSFKRSFTTKTPSTFHTSKSTIDDEGELPNPETDKPKPFEEETPYPPHLRRHLLRADVTMGIRRTSFPPKDLVSDDPVHNPDPSTYLSVTAVLGTEMVDECLPTGPDDQGDDTYVDGSELLNRDMEGWVVVVPNPSTFSIPDDFELPQELDIGNMLDPLTFLRLREPELWFHPGRGLENKMRTKSVPPRQLEDKLKAAAEERRKMRKRIRAKWNTIDLGWLDELKWREERRLENLYQIRMEDVDGKVPRRPRQRRSASSSQNEQKSKVPWWKPRYGEVGWVQESWPEQDAPYRGSYNTARDRDSGFEEVLNSGDGNKNSPNRRWSDSTE